MKAPSPVCAAALVLTCGFLVLPSGAPAQDWAGQGRLSGVVLDDSEKPIEGARVTVSPVERPGEGPPPTLTNRKGRWAVGGLAQGRWRLVISAEGFLRSEGWGAVGPGPGSAIRVVLRPLAEVAPAFAENPASVIGWLERGNSLLEQGRPAEARAEYERALRFLPGDQQPEVLRTVARTYYLEERGDDAVKALKWALLVDPGDAVSRQLFTGVHEALGRVEEGRAWLGRLDEEGVEALAGEVAPEQDPPFRLRPRLDDGLPADEPRPGRTGSYRVAFTERSPLSSRQRFYERHQLTPPEIAEVEASTPLYELAEESFEVHVPEGYDGTEGYGLFVWVSPTPSGKVRREDNLAVLADKRLIWVAANKSGNPRPRWDRIGLALDAVHSMTKLYRIDERRVYAGGYSGGGRISTMLSVLYPELFQGGFLFMGCDYYKLVPVPDKPGAVWPASFREPPREAMKRVRERNRYVFVTGEHDFNRSQTRVFHRLYKKDGFRHVTYLEIPGADHYYGVRGEWLGKGIEALDSGL